MERKRNRVVLGIGLVLVFLLLTAVVSAWDGYPQVLERFSVIPLDSYFNGEGHWVVNIEVKANCVPDGHPYKLGHLASWGLILPPELATKLVSPQSGKYYSIPKGKDCWGNVLIGRGGRYDAVMDKPAQGTLTRPTFYTDPVTENDALGYGGRCDEQDIFQFEFSEPVNLFGIRYGVSIYVLPSYSWKFAIGTLSWPDCGVTPTRQITEVVTVEIPTKTKTRTFTPTVTPEVPTKTATATFTPTTEVPTITPTPVPNLCFSDWFCRADRKYYPGWRIRTTVTIKNSGPAGLTNVTVVMTIPSFMQVLDVSSWNGSVPGQVQLGSVFWQLGNLNPGESKKIHLYFRTFSGTASGLHMLNYGILADQPLAPNSFASTFWLW